MSTSTGTTRQAQYAAPVLPWLMPAKTPRKAAGKQPGAAKGGRRPDPSPKRRTPPDSGLRPGADGGQKQFRAPADRPNVIRAGTKIKPAKRSLAQRQSDWLKEHNKFAAKVSVDMAESKFKLKLPSKEFISPSKTGQNRVWISPDGKRILKDSEAQEINQRRRSALTISDAWRDFKRVAPEDAKLLGWNKFQGKMRGLKGSRQDALTVFGAEFGLSFESYSALIAAADGTVTEGQRNGWGDSG